LTVSLSKGLLSSTLMADESDEVIDQLAGEADKRNLTPFNS